MAGYRVKYSLATKLVNELVEADDKTVATTIVRYGRVDLVCIDQLGYMESDGPGAELGNPLMRGQPRRRAGWRRRREASRAA